MLQITQMPISYNKSYKANRIIEYIVIHDTGNSGVGAGVDNHFKFFNGGNRNASADFFVDDSKIGQFNPDLKNYYMWHCGDGNGAYGITNANSIGIEICINSDGDYNKAVYNAIELVKYLMEKFNVSVNKVVRHYDASRKSCPSSMMANNWSKWNWFKQQLSNTSSTPQPTPSKPTVTYTEGIGYCTVDVLNVRSGAGTNFGVQGELNKNEKITILAKSGDWRQVKYYNAPKGAYMVGWVNGNYLRIERDVTEKSSQMMGICIADILNVRNGAGTGYAVIGQLKYGEKIKIGKEVGTWYSIYYGSNGGFVSKEFIKLV